MVFSPLVLLLILILPVPAAASAPEGFLTLCYHNVQSRPGELSAGDPPSIALAELADHFDWLKANGYRVISLDDILRARKNKRPLPPRAVLLTFDDGYLGFYHAVYPLLRAYNYKALLALETGWLETPAGKEVAYGDLAKVPRSNFLTWGQIREMADSGVVELASHSHDLHRGHLSTPQGIRQPAGASRSYDPVTKTYEPKVDYYKRVKNDLARSAEIIARRTGHRPRVAVWPYGLYTGAGVKAALEAGYALTASLDSYSEGATFPRLMVYAGMNFTEAVAAAEAGLIPGHSGYAGLNFAARYPEPFSPRFPFQRVVHVDLDLVYDPDPAQQEKNISALFDRLQALSATTVYLRAYADQGGRGTADALYFPSRHLPLRADLFNYLAWQIARRLGCRVYASMPVLGFEIQGRPLVAASGPDPGAGNGRRLTPFDPENRRIIREIYEDLASHAIIDGIVFNDDARLGEAEDFSPAGRAWLRERGLPDDPEAIRRDPELRRRFARAKTRALADFTLELAGVAEGWSGKLKTARRLQASALTGPAAEERLAQNPDDFLADYDYTAVLVRPYADGVSDPEDWLRQLADLVRQRPLGARKAVFELQAADDRRKGRRKPVPGKTLAGWMRLLRRSGLGNFGYFPEDPRAGRPEVRAIFPAFSIQAQPSLDQ